MTRLIAPLIIVLTFISCSHQDNNQELIQARLEASLEQSTNVVNMMTVEKVHNLEDKLYDSRSWMSARVWKQEAELFIKQVNPVQQKIKQLKTYPQVTGTEFNIFIHDLCKIRDSLLNRSEEINETFTSRFSFIDTFMLLSRADTSKEASGTKIAVPSYATAFLNNQLNLLVLTFVNYCDLKSGINDDTFVVPYIAITQNLDLLQPGGQLTIRAVILNENHTMYNPVIYINRRKINRNENGAAIYRIKAPVAPGKYKVPVIVMYTDLFTGKETEMKKWITFTVAKPCGNEIP